MPPTSERCEHGEDGERHSVWKPRRTYICNPEDLLHALTDRGVRLAVDGTNLRAFGPLTDDDRALIRTHKPALLAWLADSAPVPVDAKYICSAECAAKTDVHKVHDVHTEPTTHCPACGSPSWWLSPEGWCCATCTPRPVPFLGASLVIADTWADGRAPALDEEPGHPAEPEPVRPDDGRVQSLAGAWRSPEHHAARAAFYAHHDACPTCRRAGQRRGLARCDVGRALHSAYTLAALFGSGGRA